jgi:hypothetical protein
VGCNATGVAVGSSRGLCLSMVQLTGGCFFFRVVVFSLQFLIFRVHDDRDLSIWDFYTH